MLSQSYLKNRIDELSVYLKDIEKKFHETKELLKSFKKEINDTKGAISELDKLLLESYD